MSGRNHATDSILVHRNGQRLHRQPARRLRRKPPRSGIADRSIGSGDSMCYFISNSDIGRRILKDCKVGVGCKVLGTVNNDKRAGDWSPVIVEVNEISRGED